MTKKLLALALLSVLVAALGFAQTALPPPPTNLIAAQTSDVVPVAKLTWTAPAGLFGFAVYRSIEDTSHFQKIALVNAPVYFDHSVKVGSTFYYYVTTVGLTNTSTRPVESVPSNIARISFATPERALGIIAGTVTDDSTGKPIPGVRILFYAMRPSPMTITMPTAVTDSLGHYAAKLDTGAYKITAQPAPWMPPGPPAYVPEWYNNKKDYATADPVVVISNASVVADFGLSRPVPPPSLTGNIAGKVIDNDTQLPLAGILIKFFVKGPSVTHWQPTAVTDSLGFYNAVLDTGTYLVRAEGCIRMTVLTAYQPEWFDNVTDVSLATPVKVTTGSTFKANFGLSKPIPPTYASIEGTVRDTLGTPLRRATVVIRRSFQEMSVLSATASLLPGLEMQNLDVDGIGFCPGVVWSGTTDSLGVYKARVLTGQTYIAMAAKWGYAPEYYDNTPAPLLAELIKVTADVKGVDFSLAPNPVLHNSISGVVRDSAGNGIPAVVVLIPLSPNTMHARIRSGHTDSTGAYTIGEILLGTYVVMAVPFGGYAPAFYKAGAYGEMHWTHADPVLISGDVSGIDIGVAPIRANGFVRLRGRILAGGLPLAGVRIMAATQNGEIVGYGITEATGQYAIEALPVGTLTIAADCQNYASAQKPVLLGGTQYEVAGVDFSMEAQATTDLTPGNLLPESYTLGQNYPNPFNPTTTVRFTIGGVVASSAGEGPAAAHVRLSVYDLLGREVAVLVNEKMEPGSYSVRFDAGGIASGVYFYRLSVNGAGTELFSGVKKMLLMR